MASKARMELGKIKRASTMLQKRLYSSDPEVAKKANEDLADIAKALRAWHRKYRVKLYEHVETHPAGSARRRCSSRFNTQLSGEAVTCQLIGREGRKCLYACRPMTLDIRF